MIGMVLGVGTTPNSALTPQYNFLCGGSRGDGRICKYALYDGRGTGIIYINNNSGHHTAIIAFSFVSSYSAKFLYKSGDNWGHLYADNAKNIYVQHHTTWGGHLISNSTGLVADGYVTSTTGLTEITVTDNT